MARKIRRLEFGEEVDLVEHLDELRKRLFVALITLGVGFVLAFWRHGDILQLLNRQLPKLNCNGNAQCVALLHSQGGDHITPIVTGIGSAFMLAVTVSVYAAVILTLPVLFYQLYAFVIPAFSPDAARRIWPILLFVPALFVSGVAFCYAIVLPAATKFLLGFDSSYYTTLPSAKEYYSFALTLMGAMGVIFEMPAAVLILSRIGIVNSRLLRKNRKYAIVGMAALAAALPGVDPISMLSELVPLLLLYELSVWMARLVERRPKAEDAPDDVPRGTVTTYR